MTTWTANNKDRISMENLGKCTAQTYQIAAVNGNTGGTLTVGNMRKIYTMAVTGSRVTGPTIMAFTGHGYISGNTVVVAHANPGENASVFIKVWGKK